LYHAAPSPAAAVGIAAIGILTIFATQVLCAALGAPVVLQVGASFAVVAVGLVAMARADLAIVGVAKPRARFVIAAALVGLSAWYVDLRLDLLVQPPGDIAQLAHAAVRGSFVVSLLALAIAPAIGEELVFRGVLARGLARRLPLWAATLVSAIAFSAYHMVPAQMLTLLPFGLLLGVLAIRSNSVVPGMLAHATNNVIAIVLERRRGGAVAEWIDAHPTPSLVIACAGLAAALVLALANVSRPTRTG
jgi:membrane protease YdiL (CAAX protease family)